MKRRKKKPGLLSFLVLVLAAAAVLAWYDSNYRLVAEEFTVGIEDLPEGLAGLRIVCLSDVHNTVYGEDNSTLTEAVRDARPDLIAITGDLIDGSEDDKDAERGFVLDLIPRLTAIAPVYYVSGNHEWGSHWATELFGLLREMGVTVLRGEYVLISSGGESIVLAGIDDPNGRADMETPSEVIAGIREAEGEKPIVLLYHRNDRLGLWAELDIDLVLCGHAHGGLIRLPGTDGLYGPGRDFLPEHTSGLYTEGGTAMLVSRGVGGLKLRLFNNPEILVAELKKAS